MANQQAGNEKRKQDAVIYWEQRRSQVVFLYHEQGLSQAELAQHFGVVQSAMVKVLRRLGITAKSKGRAGAENGRYVHGKSSTLYRKMVRKKNCAICGTTEQLVVHHKNENHRDNTPSNLAVLCSPCHSSLHKSAWWAKRKSQ